MYKNVPPEKRDGRAMQIIGILHTEQYNGLLRNALLYVLEKARAEDMGSFEARQWMAARIAGWIDIVTALEPSSLATSQSEARFALGDAARKRPLGKRSGLKNEKQRQAAPQHQDSTSAEATYTPSDAEIVARITKLSTEMAGVDLDKDALRTCAIQQLIAEHKPIAA